MFSSCHYLLGSTAKRILVFLSSLVSLLGSLGSLFTRYCFCSSRRNPGKDATGLIVSHVNVCHCVMGVYLAVLAVADQLQGGDYVWTERVWRSSSWCSVSGFLFLLSSEVSVFVVTIATVERCWVLFSPHGNVKTRPVSALLCLFSWITGFVLTSMPAAWTVLSSSGACIPSLVPLPGQQHVHHYSVGVLVVLNGVLMLLASVGQCCIYLTVCRNETAIIVDSEGCRDLLLALRIMTVCVTDACAWFLVAALTLLTSYGLLVSTDVSFTCIMLTMVTKPSVNPYLYLYSVFLERRRQTLKQRLIQRLRTKQYH